MYRLEYLLTDKNCVGSCFVDIKSCDRDASAKRRGLGNGAASEWSVSHHSKSSGDTLPIDVVCRDVARADTRGLAGM